MAARGERLAGVRIRRSVYRVEAVCGALFGISGMPFLRAALAFAGLLLPPAIAAFLIHLLYELGWVMSAVVFFVLLSLWAEGLRALRRMD